VPPRLDALLNGQGASESSSGGYSLTITSAAATAAIAPFFVVRWHIAFYPTTLLEAAIIITLALFAYESWRARAIPSWRGPLLLPTLVLLLAGAISVLDAPSRLAALGIYRAYFIEPVAFALALVTAIRSARHAHAILIGLCAGASVLAAVNAVTVLIAIKSYAFNVAASPPVSIYTAANAVALYLVPLIAVAAAVAVHGKDLDRRLRIAYAALVALAGVTTLLTFSRGGWLALAAVAVGLAISHQRRWLLLGGLAIAAVVVALIPAIHQRIALEFQITGTSQLGGRVALWKVSLKMLESHWLLGAGIAGYAQRVSIHDLPYQIAQIYPHNIVLDFWSETGLLGAIAFIALVVVAIAVAWKGWRSAPPEWRPIQLGVLLALAAIAVHGMVDNPYWKNDLAFEFWTLVALSLAGARIAATTRPGPATPTPRNQDRARTR
jgi:O-antigen ligase